MSEKHLHIISLNVPYPVSYGGLFDLFYKLPALQQQNVHIYLHCFEYGTGEQDELNKYCDQVYYYKRQKGHKTISTWLPHIVASRRHEGLLENLLKDDYPIFMEGIHCTYLLNDDRFTNRKKFVRIHNVEYQYYQHLYESAVSPFLKIYYKRESHLLEKYERSIVTKANGFWGVSQKDVDYYRKEMGCRTIEYLPVYLPPEWKVKCMEGKGSYCLYQGDLSIDTNERAAVWLLQKIFNELKLPLVIAGKHPSKRLERLAHAQQYTCLVADPDEKEMQDMITRAHINILPSFSNTGVKLKLLNALFNGRHCVVNKATVEGSGLDSLCYIADNEDATKDIIRQLYEKPFNCDTIEKRDVFLKERFNNENNARQQISRIWDEKADNL
jgi:hypothetical protein